MDLARPRRSTTTHRNPVVVGACVLSAVLHAAVAVVAPEHVVAMPTAPPPVPVVAALGAALLVAAVDRTGLPARARSGLVALCAVEMLAGSLLAVPHTLLIALIWAVGRVTGGTGPFDVAPDWLTSAAHLATVAAVGLLVAWAVRDRRVHRGLCPACGRADHGRTSAHRSALPWLAALTVAGSLPYGLLKLAWAFGWTGGLTGHAFDGVSFTSPGFGDTAVLTGVSVVAAAAMGARAAGRWTRRVLIAIGTIGSLMLLPVAAVGVVRLVPVLLGLTAIDDSEIAVWAFLVVYGSFLAWGTALAALTITYRQETRGTCREAEPAVDRP